MVTDTIHTRDQARGKSISDYMPLLSLVSVSIIGSLAIISSPLIPFEMVPFMHFFMGLYLMVLALLKFFDLNKFADGFAMYDLLAKRWRGYGQIYPFIELLLALGFLSMLATPLFYVFTIAFMLFGAAGVVKALNEGVDIYCPCMGNILKVPLSTVTLAENFGMAFMAAMLLLML